MKITLTEESGKYKYRIRREKFIVTSGLSGV